MVDFPAPFDRRTDGFDSYDEFVPDHLPRPGSFLTGHILLTGTPHTAFHRLTRELFEERGVYDVTFGYNLARLNLDQSHDSAGFRYAVDATDQTVLRAEFTPTTAFCPQAETLAVASLRAWNGERDRHEFDLVRVRVAEMHAHSAAINDQLEGLEERVGETGSVPPATGSDDGLQERSAENTAEGRDIPF